MGDDNYDKEGKFVLTDVEGCIQVWVFGVDERVSLIASLATQE